MKLIVQECSKYTILKYCVKKSIGKICIAYYTYKNLVSWCIWSHFSETVRPILMTFFAYLISVRISRKLFFTLLPPLLQFFNHNFTILEY